MNWTNQAETMVKAWAETQKNLWENWYNMTQTASQNSPFAINFADQWSDMASQGFEAWTAQTDPTAKNTAERLREGQKTIMDFMAFSAKAWQQIGQKLEAGQDWQAVLNGYLDQLRQQLSQKPGDLFAAAKNSNELWQLYQKQTQTFMEPWLQAGQQIPGFFGQALNGQPSALGDLAGLYSQVYQNTFGQLIDSPTLGYTRELETKIRQGFQAWLTLNESSLAYQTIVGEAWLKAFEGVQQKLVELSQEGTTVKSLAELSTLWTNVAEDAFLEVYRTEKYIRIQGKLVSSVMAYRLFQRDIIELLCKLNDIPTRTEVDEAHRANYLLRKEVKALKKTIAGLGNNTAELAEARQTVATLQQDVEDLKKAVAELRSAPVQSTPNPPRKTRAKAKPTTPKIGQEASS